eukprot:m.172597 g.172597  ORF g.172597 m.172597 type:complete len:792 (+) comp16722_c0_seq1:196-2571(+)
MPPLRRSADEIPQRNTMAPTVPVPPTVKTGPPTILTPKRVSFCVLISTIFALIYLWFRRGIYAVWDSLAFNPSNIVPGALPSPGQNLSDDEQFQFAFIASTTHTLAVVVGMLLFAGTSTVFSSYRVHRAVSSKPKLRVLQLGSMMLLGYGFFHALSSWFTYKFSQQQSQAYKWARGFFYEDEDAPFASCASISYCLCLLSGYLIKLSTDGSRFSAFPPCYRRYIWRGLAYFLISFVSFRFVAIPFYKAFTHPLLSGSDQVLANTGVDHRFVALATGTHTLALGIGMLACFLTLQGYKVYSDLSCTVPPAFRLGVTSIVMVTWVTLIVYAVVQGAIATAAYVRIHWKEMDPRLLSLSHLVWFSWGCLLLSGTLPSLAYGFAYSLTLPFKLFPNPQSRCRRLWRFLVVSILYNLEKVTVTLLVLSLVFAPTFPNAITAAWLAIIVRYSSTYRNNPALTGCRQQEDFKHHWMFDELISYFDFDLFNHNSKPLNPNHRYLFGFHPHGVLPISIGFVQNNEKWRRAFTGIEPAPLTSSILHHVPLMRDFLQLVGGGDVSKQGIAATMDRAKSVVLVPGGQQEMIHTSSSAKTVTVCAKHKGFIKLVFQLAAASEEPFHLVPMFNFGENKILDNIPVPVAWQEASVKKLRANVFFGPWGWLGLPGIPRPSTMRLAVAQAIQVPRIAQPTAEDVAVLHGRYMSSLQEVYQAYKGQAPGYHDVELVFDSPVETVTESQWEEYRASLVETGVMGGWQQLFPPTRGDRLEMMWTSIFWLLVFGWIAERAFFESNHSILQLL